MSDHFAAMLEQIRKDPSIGAQMDSHLGMSPKYRKRMMRDGRNTTADSGRTGDRKQKVDD